MITLLRRLGRALRCDKSSLILERSSIGRAAGLYPVLASDKREVVGSSPAAPTSSLDSRLVVRPAPDKGETVGSIPTCPTTGLWC